MEVKRAAGSAGDPLNEKVIVEGHNRPMQVGLDTNRNESFCVSLLVVCAKNKKVFVAQEFNLFAPLAVLCKWLFYGI